MTDHSRSQSPDDPIDMPLHPAYQQVRDMLRAATHEPTPAPTDVLEVAMAAAMAQAPAALGTTSAPASLTARRGLHLTMRQRWVTAAACAVVLFAIAAVERRANTPTSSYSRTLTTAAPSAGADTQQASVGSAAPVAKGALGTVPTDAITGVSVPAKSLIAVGSVSDLAAVADQFSSAVPDPSGSSGSLPLATNAAVGTAAPAADVRPSIGCTLQPGEVVVAEVSFQGTDAWVLRVVATGAVRAVALDCTELAHTP